MCAGAHRRVGALRPLDRRQSEFDRFSGNDAGQASLVVRFTKYDDVPRTADLDIGSEKQQHSLCNRLSRHRSTTVASPRES